MGSWLLVIVVLFASLATWAAGAHHSVPGMQATRTVDCSGPDLDGSTDGDRRTDGDLNPDSCRQ